MAIQNIATYYDEFFQIFYVSGEVVNNSGSYERITKLMPVVYDENGEPATTESDVEPSLGYDFLLETISLAPEESLAFGFIVFLPEDLEVDNNYEILIDTTPAETTRKDLEVVSHESDDEGWPDDFIVQGTFDNPGPDLTEYVAIVVTLYDEVDQVIGIDWVYLTSASDLATGLHEFEVEIYPLEIVYIQDSNVADYEIQLFGY